VKLEITDDGTGFDPAHQPASGMGLRLMRDRAFAIHGQLSVQPAKGGGSCIRCVCPQPPASANQSLTLPNNP
jgi:two-component system nitrate/nitrite sensor histidine kinase NarX